MSSPISPEESGHQPDERERVFYRRRAKEFLELHEQVETSVNLLDNLQFFLSTFQKDLSAVSGQISELQDRSKDIDNRLKSRKRIERPLSNLISDLTIPPSLATLILDTDVGEPWILDIDKFEQHLDATKVRSRVKAGKDLGEVAEGLRIVAATKLRAFFLALLQPIRGSVTTNMQVIQTSILVKYRPLFAFLQRQALPVAQEVQRAYTGAARLYYETGFRRYVRSLGWIKARTTEKFESIVTAAAGKSDQVDEKRLSFAKLDGPGVTLAYMADDKTHLEPVEALFRSLLLVLMDNGTAEYTFITTFFPHEPLAGRPSQSSTALLSPRKATLYDVRSDAGSEGPAGRARGNSILSQSGPASAGILSKEEKASMDAIWKQVMDPVLEYCQNFARSVIEPVPPVVTLLTMIRLTEDVVNEVQKRRCPPLESFIFSLRLQLWPVFQKAMSDHSDALKKLAEGSGGGYFTRGPSITDDSVTLITRRYVTMFKSFVILTEQDNETMIFSNLSRLRQELTKLIVKHTESIADPSAKATKQSTIYEELLQGLKRGTHLTNHPKSDEEQTYWAGKEEGARRQINSGRRPRGR